MLYLTLLLTFLSAISPFGSFNALVIGISDGDTITVLTEENQRIKIRLSGIDCPELQQDFGQRAKQYTSSHCFGKNVKIEKQGTDRFKRILANVYVGKICINKELVRYGLAWCYRNSRDLELINLELSARNHKIGLWSQPDPVAPWEFRHTHSRTSGHLLSVHDSAKDILN
jgi:micrococcal nuclease